MKKIPTVFIRGNDGKITSEIHSDCKWVFTDSLTIWTEKLNGTNVRLTVEAGKILRLEARRNPTKQQKLDGIVTPWYREVCTSHPLDPIDKHIVRAAACTDVNDWTAGEHCCEAIGPKIQGNELGLETPVCVPFDIQPPVFIKPHRFSRASVDRYSMMTDFLEKLDSVYSPGHLAEGVVFHHPCGYKAKIKRKDFLAVQT